MVLITVFRTLFYQFLLIFIGLSIGFICNAEWFGIKSLLINRSVNNIFFPLDYENDQQLRSFVKSWGSYKVYVLKGSPKGFEIIDDNVYYNEEWYWCRFKYIDDKGNNCFDEGSVRVKWKTWEYYYDYNVLDTPEKIQKEIEKTKEDINNRKKAIEQSKEKEKELMQENEKIFTNIDDVVLL